MSPTKQVLFVDDEPRVLSGLRRMSHAARGQWQAFFAGDGREALAVLSEQPIDVVVSDIYMPGVNGVELLTEVRKQHPRTVRFALSGQASKGAVLESVGLVHQYLAKPCDADSLMAALHRVFALEETLACDSLKATITGLEVLASVPALYDALLEQLAEPQPSIKQIAATISQDVGMSLRILQLVSTLFFARPVRTLSPAHAAAFLGADILEALARSPSALSRWDAQQDSRVSLAELCRHARTTAAFARRIAELEGAGRSGREEALVAGLLHDVGKVLLATRMPEAYDSVLSAAGHSHSETLEAERAVFGNNHAEAGAYLLALWGLPDGVVRAARCHHCPSGARPKPAKMELIVHVADLLAHESGAAGVEGPMPAPSEASAARAPWRARVSLWREACRTLVPQESLYG